MGSARLGDSMTKAKGESLPSAAAELDDAALASASAGFLPEKDDQVLIRAQMRPATPDACKWELSEFDALTRPK